MPYHLLTGATGLLGSYLLMESLRAGQQIAVLARPTRAQSARQRIETIVARWERELGQLLPRPVVLKGDITQTDLDLDASSVRWIGRNCQSVIHNAASLTFHGGSQDSEPWLSNVEGTRHMLELCHCLGIRQFHHVSTAYVCGKRREKILESQLDEGQEFGNVYEKSKLEAEKLVRGASFLDRYTIYRPAIIIGDSRTGYTTTFHSFYAFLKLAHTLVSKVVLGSTGARLIIGKLGLVGSEHKNFVPVDWVAKVIAHIHRSPEHHGKTFHLTTPQPISVADMAAVIQEVVEKYSSLADPADPLRCDGAWFEDVFKTQMEVYRSYWLNDPNFDCANTLAAAARYPCPYVDRDMLTMMAKYAIQANFGKSTSHAKKTYFDMHDYFQHLLPREDEPIRAANGETVIGLQVDGPGGGQWEFEFHAGHLVRAESGISSRSKVTCHLNSGDFLHLTTRQVSLEQALQTGKARIDGNGTPLADIKYHLETVIKSCRRNGLQVGAGVS